jgi:hypothetical protein
MVRGVDNPTLQKALIVEKLLTIAAGRKIPMDSELKRGHGPNGYRGIFPWG